MAGNTVVRTRGQAPAAPKTFNCPACGSPVLLRAQGSSITAVCRSCGSVIDTADENLRIISRSKKIGEPLIPLGQRGKLRGTLWEVIGYMERSDGSGIYSWREFLLFNPFRGYRWLMEFDGHWNYLAVTKDRSARLRGARSGVSFLGRDFFLFHKGTAKVTAVLGEFYWRVKVGDTVTVEDYVYPPELLTAESSRDEVNWSIGEYVEPETIAAAFAIKPEEMPVRRGVAPNQPSTIKPVANTVMKYWGLFLAAVILVQCLLVFTAHNEQVFRSDFTWQLNQPPTIAVSEPFTLRYGTANLAFRLVAPWLDNNSWLEVEVELVNDQTGATYSFAQGVEVYSGRDEEGYWSEGSLVNDKLLSSIPEGLYHLNLQATGPLMPNAATTERHYTLLVQRDVVTWSNFFLALLALSVVPIIAAWRQHSFEQARWSTSDFSPYWSESGDEE